MAKPTSRQLKEYMAELPKGAMAWLCGVSDRTFGDWPGVPQNPVAGKERPTYNAQQVIAWRLEELTGNTKANDDDRAEIRKLRGHQAELAEIEVKRKRDEVIDRAEFFAWFDAEVAGSIRKGLERLQRKFGREAVDLVTAGLNQADAAKEQRFGK